MEVGPGRKRTIDWTAAVMALATTLLLAFYAYRQFRQVPIDGPPPVGSVAPPLALTDADTHEPAIVFGRPGHVLWVSFWSPNDREASREAAALDRTWRRLQGRRPFAMVVTVLEADPAQNWRAAFQGTARDLPLYLARGPTRRAFGVAKTPLHLLIDGDGRVVSVTTGGAGALDEMARHAERLMEEIAPSDPRFAQGPHFPRTFVRR